MFRTRQRLQSRLNHFKISHQTDFLFKKQFYQRNYKPYPITQNDQLSVHITNGVHNQHVPCSIEFGDLNPSLANTARVSFSAKKSGKYMISICVGNSFTHIRGSPFSDIEFRPLSPSSYVGPRIIFSTH